MRTRWVDLVDPTREEALAALPGHVDPEVVEVLATPPGAGAHEPRPLLEAHGASVFGVFVAARPVPDEDRIAYQEVDVVATPELLVTARKTSDGLAFDPAVVDLAAEDGDPVGVLIHRLVDEIASSFLTALDASYAEIEEVEDAIDRWPSRRVRSRIAELRHELLVLRKMVSATRAAVRRILDGRIEVGDHSLFPPEVERMFGETYETLQRATEELDIARDLLAGVRDHHQSQIAETNADIGKKLTVVASLVLVPSLIVGFYGQNFEEAFGDAYWSLGMSTALIVLSTIAQLALYRWRRWI
jgi:Mg2+ and Co2+ transporter CorA